MSTHKSDSSEQQSAEAEILGWLVAERGYRFDSSAKLPIDIDLQPDAIDPGNKVVVEVYARVGKAAGGQLQKIKGDILKFALLSQKLSADWKYLYCFASSHAASSVTGSGWVGCAARTFGVEVLVCPISEDMEATLVAAQARQRMVNP